MIRSFDGGGGSRSHGIKFGAGRTAGPSDTGHRKDMADRRRRFLSGNTAHYPMEGTFTPVEALDYLETDPMVCLLCGRGFQMLGRHLAASHKISSREYCELYLIPWSQPSPLSDAGHPTRRARGLATRRHRRELSERQTAEHRKAASDALTDKLETGMKRGNGAQSPGNRAIQRARAKCHEPRTCEFCEAEFTTGRTRYGGCCCRSCCTKLRHRNAPPGSHGHFGRYGKFSEADVIAVRESRETHILLARVYDVAPTMISDIRLGNAYAHFGGPIRKAAHRNRTLTAEKVLEIRASSETIAVLARRYGMGATTIYQVLSGSTWAHVGGRLRAPAGASREIDPVTGRFLPAEPAYRRPA